VAADLTSCLGLIAGDGSLPLEVARGAKASGRNVCAVAYTGITDPSLQNEVDSTTWLHLGELSSLLAAFAGNGVKQAIMAGKVSKQHLYGDTAALRPDARALELVSKISDLRDDSILEALARVLAEDGIELLPQLHFCPQLVVTPGVLGEARPTAAHWADIAFAWPIAKAVGGLDLGQSLIVESQAILAVEAIEGTDAAIRRGGALGRGGGALVKVAKPGQDPRYDVPTIGPATLRTMLDSNVAVLAFEASCTILLEREELMRIADAHGVPVVAIGASGPESISTPDHNRS
jgi:UDP-2,3-diacylglucosamine hydrolase